MKLFQSVRTALRSAVHAYFRRFPGRPPQEPVRRLMSDKYIVGSGLEIGALHLPLSVSPQVRVTYVDRRSKEDSRPVYPELRWRKLVDVDIVDNGEHLGTGPDASQDFVVANHFLEHCQDPIGTLLNHLRVLRPGGVLFLLFLTDDTHLTKAVPIRA